MDDAADDIAEGSVTLLEKGLDKLTDGGYSEVVEYVESATGIDVHDTAVAAPRVGGEALGDAAYDATSEETHQAALAHSEAAGEAWDAGNYGTAVYEGAATAGTIVEGLAESAWDAITGSDDE